MYPFFSDGNGTLLPIYSKSWEDMPEQLREASGYTHMG
jgi:hypothetical protein